MNLPPYVFDVDCVAKIRSELSITVLEKKTEQNYRLKKSDLTETVKLNQLFRTKCFFANLRTKVTRKTIPTPPPEKCPKRPIVFLKTHKTASTSLTNIVLRWAEKNKFLVGLPPPKKWELGGYPAPFDPNLVDPAAKA